LCTFRLAEYLEHEPARKKAAAEAQRAKLEALERKLGIEGGAGSSSNNDAQVAGRKHRFDDTEYLEQSRELVDNVKSAVTAGWSSSPFSPSSMGILGFCHSCIAHHRTSKEAQKNQGGTEWFKIKTRAYKGIALGSAGDSGATVSPQCRGYFVG
jgi:hypothetical protein